jgi:hypothetical protein
MFHDNQVYEVDKVKIDTLNFDAGVNKVQKLFSELKQLSEKHREPKTVKKYFPHPARNPMAAVTEPAVRECISPDDITNLKIDLETSNSVNEFLRKLL